MRPARWFNQRLIDAGIDVRSRVLLWCSAWYVPVKTRPRLLNRLGCSIDPTAVIGTDLRLQGSDLTVGPGCYLTGRAFLDTSGGITIGSRVAMGPMTTIWTSAHDIGGQEQRMGLVTHAPVKIGDGCWLNTTVTVLAGVTIGDGCIIAAGSVVRSDCEPNGFYAGVPARRVRDLSGRG
jgi:maltose O-acetyltransferase